MYMKNQDGDIDIATAGTGNEEGVLIDLMMGLSGWS
jgi:hypothetical protein